MDRWVGKVAVVTGASSGIGAAVAKDLADRGIVVVAVARRLERLEELAKNSKGKIYPKKCDLQVETEIISVFRWIESTLGGVDIMVNNSGMVHLSSLMAGETSKWKQMIDTNLTGLSICTREALKTMRQRGDNGHIFHINSIAGHHVVRVPGFPVGMYTATKQAVTALTEALRVELQEANSQIKITSISPGGVFTEMVTGVGGDATLRGRKREDFLDSEDISEALLYSLGTKPKVQVHEILIQPIGQKYN